MKKHILLLATAILVTVAIGYAWTIQSGVPVDPNSCADTDLGLNFTQIVSINFTINQTTYGPIVDYCLNSTTVAEFACSNDIPSLNLTDYALMVSEDCTIALNSTNATCLNGMCIP